MGTEQRRTRPGVGAPWPPSVAGCGVSGDQTLNSLPTGSVTSGAWPHCPEPQFARL